MEKDVVLREVAKHIRAKVGQEYKLVLFGSWARGDAHERSDIDIGILGPEKLSTDVYYAIRSSVDTIPTLRTIDIVDLMSVSERFRAKAISEGIPVA
jgi:uncharacterized protein